MELVVEGDGAGFAYFKRHASSLNVTLLMTVFGPLALFSLLIAARCAARGCMACDAVCGRGNSRAESGGDPGVAAGR